MSGIGEVAEAGQKLGIRSGMLYQRDRQPELRLASWPLKYDNNYYRALPNYKQPVSGGLAVLTAAG